MNDDNTDFFQETYEGPVRKVYGQLTEEESPVSMPAPVTVAVVDGDEAGAVLSGVCDWGLNAIHKGKDE